MRTAAPPIKETSAPGSGIEVKFGSVSDTLADGRAPESAPCDIMFHEHNTTIIMANAAMSVRLTAGVCGRFKVVEYSGVKPRLMQRNFS
jgi:hypothetical protein